MRVEDLDKICIMRNVTETVKQLIIINVLFFVGTLALGILTPQISFRDVAHFSRNPSFQFVMV
jgi:hypothetical protein